MTAYFANGFMIIPYQTCLTLMILSMLGKMNETDGRPIYIARRAIPLL
ncbi:MAG: hypothetical protein WAV76_11455 [Bacteroidota bacterium]